LSRPPHTRNSSPPVAGARILRTGRGTPVSSPARIALRGRRLAGGEPDLALGDGESGHRVHQHQNVLVEIAKIFRNRERDGWGRTKLEKLFLLFRGLPFLSITPEVYNLRHQAINFVSTYRWDAQKRRVEAEFSGPFRGNPKFRYGLIADLRSENWDIRDSFQGPAPLLASLNLRRESVGLNFASFESGRWRWSAGG